MYQVIENSNSNVENFNILMDAFNRTVFKLNNIESNNTEFLIGNGNFYIINHATFWNKVDNIGKECIILEKNDKLALVMIRGQQEIDTLANLYRLEDLTLKLKN